MTSRRRIDISSSSEDDTCHHQKIWSKGEACLARYSGDGCLYPARIKKLSRGIGVDNVRALVSFDDYDSEEDEEILVSRLETPKQTYQKKILCSPARDNSSLNTSIFKPLSGTEESSRLERKFETEDSDDEVNYTPRTRGKVSEWKMSIPGNKKSPSLSQRRKKAAVVTGGDKKTRAKSSSNTPRTKDKGFHNSQEASTSTGGETSTNKQNKVASKIDIRTTARSDVHEDEMLGFTEEDMEKPKFSFTPSAAKVPFVLSDRGDNPVVQVPATINQYLRDYQREGIRFLYSHYKVGRGAILGDDMGLGKTVQVIGLLAALLHKQGNRVDVMRQKPKFIRKLSDSSDLFADMKFKPFLIIGPGSVLYNWLDELETWGYFTASKFHGADKKTCLAEVKKGKLEVVVTTFETFRDNMSDLNSIDWEAVIVDEVHRIKGLRAQTTQALRCLHTEKRYGLTGTALQNNMTELWSILDWAQPQVLGSLTQFETELVQVIERGQKHDATKRELALARKKKEEFSNKRLEMMIRRTKKLIADQLPEKDDNVVFCKLTPLQESVYRAVLGHRDMSLVLRMDDPCDCESRRKRSKCCHKTLEDGSNITSVMFSFMHLLLKTANHVALLTPHANSSPQQKRRTNDVCKVAFQDHPEFLEQSREASFRTLSDPKFCGKMKILQGLLSVFSKSHSKVLVFSYSTRLLDILEQYIISNGHEYRRIDGSVNNRRRMEIVREFNRDQSIFVCLISTKAGGLGLNLTGANKVVIFDPNWNPSHDLQAQDRAYRIGQRKNVAVYRLISVGTIEENIYLRQIYKQQLGNVAVSDEAAKRFFHGIQGDRFHKGELFGVKNMFQLRTGESCLTMDILERNEKVEAGMKGLAMSKYLAPMDASDDQEPEVETDERETTAVDSTEEESEDALRHLIDTDEDSGLDLASPPPSPAERTLKERRMSPRSKKQSPSTMTRDVSNSQSFGTVSSVFEKCGVMHVHKNVKVVGTSRAEEHMSRCAIQEVYELHQNSQVPAMQVDPYSESSEEEKEPTPPPRKKGSGRGRGRNTKPKADHNTPRILEHDTTKILIGQTPVGIRRQHFSKMATSIDSEQMSLAERIVGGSTESRLELLREFYTKQYPHLEEAIRNSLTVVREETVDTPSSVVKSGSRSARKKQEKMIPKKRGRPRKARQGLSFLDYEHTESQSGPESRPVLDHLDHQESDLSSLDIGKKTKMTTRSRTPRGRKRPTQTQSVAPTLQTQSLAPAGSVAPTEDFDLLFDVPSRINRLLRKPAGRKVNIASELTFTDVDVKADAVSEDVDQMFGVQGREKSEDLDNLLMEIGQSVRDKRYVVDKQDVSETSILDDIFSSKVTKRKPAPPKKKKNESYDLFSSKASTSGLSSPKKRSPRTDNSSDLFSPQASTSGLFSPKRKAHQTDNSCDLFSPKSSTSESDLTSDFLNESTLVDDSVDCFSEHKKWKKKKKSPVKSSVDRVKRLLKESNDDFERLLESGKLKKKYHKPEGETSDRDFQDKELDRDSASLFS